MLRGENREAGSYWESNPGHLWLEPPVLRAFCLTLEIKEFRCYEVKIEESEKASESNQEHLWLELLVLCH